MNELNEKDWELVNAYHDGELGDAERRALEARLLSEPELEEALKDIASVSASLGALRPEPQPPFFHPTDKPANQNWRPAKWLIGGAAATAIALTVILGPRILAEPTAFDIHARFSAQAYAVDSADIRPAAAGNSLNTPDLVSASLTPVAMRQVKDGHVTHYAGRNGCRLSYFRGTSDPGEPGSASENQVAAWSTSDDMWHMIVATGMDQDKFKAIAAYLKLTTRQQASEQMMASLAETTATASRCLS